MLFITGLTWLGWSRLQTVLPWPLLCLVLASAAYTAEHELRPLGRLVAYSHAGVEPRVMGIGPIPAVRKVLDRADMKLDEIDIFEVNEAFAAQALA